MSNEIVLSNTTLFGNPKRGNDKQIAMLSSYFNVSDAEKLQVSVLCKTVEHICLVEYGPMLSVNELEKFVSVLTKSSPVLKRVEGEIFAHFVNLMTNLRSKDYILSSSAIIMRFNSYCFIIKFGSAEQIDYIIDLDVHTLYGIKDDDRFSRPFTPGTDDLYAGLFSTIKSEYLKAAEMKLTMQFTQITESFAKETYDCTVELERSRHNVVQLRSSTAEYLKKINSTNEAFEESEETFKSEFSALASSIGIGKDTRATNQRTRLLASDLMPK